MNIFLAMKLLPFLQRSTRKAALATGLLGFVAVGMMACGGADERDTDRLSRAARAKQGVMVFDSTAVVFAAHDEDAAGGAVDGAQVYTASCMVCHQQDGSGMAGSWPPLAASEWLINNPEVPTRIVLHGIHGPITVRGNSYNNVMQPWADLLNDEQIAAVLTYARSSWGNNAPPVTVEQVAAVRESTKDRTEMWTADELKDLINAQ